MGDEDWDTEIQGRVASFVPNFQPLDDNSGRTNDHSFNYNQSINSADAGVGPIRNQPMRGGFGTGRSFGNRAALGNKFEERNNSGFQRDSTGDSQSRSRTLSRRGAGFQEGNCSERSGTQRRGTGGFRGGRGGFGQSHINENEQQEQQSGSIFISRRGGFGGPTGDNDNNKSRGFGRQGGYRGYNEEVIAGSGRSSWKSDGENEDGDYQGPKVTYVPPPPPDNEEAIFAHYQTGINFDKYDTILVEVSGLDPPPAILTFEEANLCQTLIKNIAKAGYSKLTPVQKYSIPIILAGRDLMACAQTGSGKTAAFLLPILDHMMKDGITASHFREQQEPECIIVAPTRELINQIFLEARKFAYGTCIRPVVIYGGTQTGHSIRQIMQGCNILCATPGRLMDIIGKEKIGLHKVRYLVLDEADRMLDMGFGPEMKKLISCPGMPSKDRRQTLMFSATFPEEIQRLAGEFLKPEYLFVAVGQVGGACSDVQQTILQVSQYSKREKLVEILQSIRDERTMVFVETKKKADFIATFLCQEKIATTSIHGDREQREREEALWDFRSGKCPVLVATSVAARGLDIENVQHVINFDLPSTIDEYVHRIGRTGRCGNIGKAISFFDSVSDSHIAQPLVKVLSDAQQEVPSWLEEIAFSTHGMGFSNPRGNIFASVDTRKTFQDKDMNAGGFTMSYATSAAESWD
ncbi:putative ATP-dependent RNA helicase DDX4 isoform X1 [Pelodiscus sinensis]|uniref:putative ATP-dependent RNA helicase DDX4 isoform X1 n=1 Tax=Pelodiscus sinensis TaxID=13735 RepID=UPI000D71FF27|nr:probable ATP-dependent RNA helicase DDX4 [Pelodiscus sinensis]|eukprot:XP_025035454.1 probable ATP-dependent RNA helicase DDX4 [Pelodiscus sinensis]